MGLVVVVGDSGSERIGRTAREEAGSVIIARRGRLHRAEVGSNNTGIERSVRPPTMALVEGGDEEAVIRADSTYAGNLASGRKAKANRELVAHVQARDEVAGLRPLSWSHVKAHRGHRWNERADHLAARQQVVKTPSRWRLETRSTLVGHPIFEPRSHILPVITATKCVVNLRLQPKQWRARIVPLGVVQHQPVKRTVLHPVFLECDAL